MAPVAGPSTHARHDASSEGHESSAFGRFLAACSRVTAPTSACAQKRPRDLAARFPIRSAAESPADAVLAASKGDAGPEWAPSDLDQSLVQRSVRWKDELMRTSPMLRFMTKHLALVSCPVDGASRTDGTGIMILPCAPGAAGGFGPNEPREHSAILICGNRMMDKGHLEDTLAHEMTHFWDHCRFKVDWDDLRHVACSEVRAASLSGDCSMKREMWKNRNYNFVKGHQTCVRRRAALSVAMHPKCKDQEQAESIVDQVFNSCFRDTRPFDEIY